MTRKASNFNTLARKLGLVGCAKRWRPPGRAATMDAGANHGLYAALGLTFAAELDLDVVKKAYRKMSLKYHPVRVRLCCCVLPPCLTALPDRLPHATARTATAARMPSTTSRCSR